MTKMIKEKVLTSLHESHTYQSLTLYFGNEECFT